MQRSLAWLLGVVLLLSMCTAALLTSVGSATQCVSPQDIRPGSAVGSVTAKSLNPAQLENARLIISIGDSRGRNLKEIRTALMVAKQESNIKNIPFGHLDSIGMFQQRRHYGTVKQRLDPVFSTNEFYKEMERVKGRGSMTELQLALRTQRPSPAAYSSRSNNFESWRGLANELLANYKPKATGASGASGPTTSRDAPPAMVYEDCDPAGQPGMDGATANGKGFAKPLDSLRVGSPYGQRFHPILRYWRLHDGVDLSASSGQKIYSVCSGKLILRTYNSGAGNYIKVDCGNGDVVTYMHMSRFGDYRVGNQVKAGAVLGYVGSTGLSTAPHLHLGWRKNGRSVDPVPQLCGHGINVPGPRGCAKLT